MVEEKSHPIRGAIKWSRDLPAKVGVPARNTPPNRVRKLTLESEDFMHSPFH